MSHDGRAVANFVLDNCAEPGISNLSLQKVVYFCHVWSLIEREEPLIAQSFEAWEFGPVLPYLYREFKEFDRAPIHTRARKIDALSGRLEVVRYTFEDDTRKLLARTVAFYSRIRPGDLVEMTHVHGGPWYSVWNHRGAINPGMKISNDDIVKFYSGRLSRFKSQ